MISAYWDFEEQYGKDPTMDELHIFEKTDTSFICYERRKLLPGPVTAQRDSLSKYTLIDKGDGKKILITVSVKRDDLMPEKEGVFRMDIYKSQLFE
jgi:hypothetical protein